MPIRRCNILRFLASNRFRAELLINEQIDSVPKKVRAQLARGGLALAGNLFLPTRVRRRLLVPQSSSIVQPYQKVWHQAAPNKLQCSSSVSLYPGRPPCLYRRLHEFVASRPLFQAAVLGFLHNRWRFGTVFPLSLGSNGFMSITASVSQSSRQPLNSMHPSASMPKKHAIYTRYINKTPMAQRASVVAAVLVQQLGEVGHAEGRHHLEQRQRRLAAAQFDGHLLQHRRNLRLGDALAGQLRSELQG